MYRRRLGRIGFGGLYATPGCARTPGNNGLAAFGGVFELFYERFAADNAIHAVFGQRRVAFHGQDVVAFVFFDDFINDSFSIVPGCRHDGVVVIQRQHRQDHVLG